MSKRDFDTRRAFVAPMRLAFVIAAVVVCVVPSVAPAATVGGKTRHRDGTTFGTMKFKASAGVANRVVVKPIGEYDSFRVTDRAERVRATGECEQDGRRSAICPWTESDNVLAVRVGGRADRVRVRGNLDVLVRGGSGDDVLRGNGDEMFGNRGDDTLRGGGGWDRLHAGPGRDHVNGRGASRFLEDIYYDDETDRQAARDTYIADESNRAELHYSRRERDLRIDLRDRRIAPEGDRIDGVKGLMGGSGDDVFIGTGGSNRLQGGPGDDRLFGRPGGDHLSGGKGDDRMFGADGDDWLTEGPYWDSTAGGRDMYRGGDGRDELVSLDSLEDDETEPDDVRCDRRDQAVESDANDRLRGCLAVKGWDIGEFEMRTRPQLTAEGAAFALRCGPTESEQVRNPDGTDEITFRCHGRLTVRGANGEEYGSREFSFEVDFSSQTEQTVTVPLTDAGRAAIARGDVVTVEAEPLSSNGYDIPAAGYRARIG